METMPTVKTVEDYSTKHNMSIAEVWMKMSNAYLDMDMQDESDRCYANYLSTK